ncbi:MAG: peptide chain release factor N(5)-glutamine methyltransferase [Clostridia bacterium]|nr:peptide chain release factor N(5)-glutamine methyltransferase [Clostridia bacterium]
MTLTSIAERLREAGIAPDDARHEALLLLEHVTRLSPAALLADRGRDFDSPALLDAVERRAAREPLQYILGAWDFCGLTLRVDRRCLIPRPDTEVVAERAAELLPANGRFLDLCTGSGCIAAAVCALSADRHTSGVALELDPDTADLARENLAALGFADRCPVVTADLRDDPFGEEVFDVIVSNPPYVTAEEMAGLAPELAWEPRIALTDGGDGLTLIREILRLYRKHLAPGGVLLIEHGWQQADAVRTMAEEEGYAYAAITDYGGNVRAGELRIKNAE